MSQSIQATFKVIHIVAIIRWVNPCWLVNKACVPCQQPAISGLPVSCHTFEMKSVMSNSLQFLSVSKHSGFCVCVWHGKLCDDEHTLRQREAEGVRTCLPDGGVTGSEFTSVCGALMNAGVSHVDKIAVWLDRQDATCLHLCCRKTSSTGTSH